jgi:Fe-S oxidoreductase
MGAGDHLLPTGCCGMAGAYGYRTKTAEVSAKIGREQWAPNLDRIPKDNVLVADGFSCRSQARNVAGREALHLAQWWARNIKQRKTESGVVEVIDFATQTEPPQN